jgi:hypothetical protein
LGVIVAGRSAELFFLIVLSGLIAFAIYLARKGKVPELRKLEAVEVIDETIGRATEMGKPILYVPGGNLDDVEAPQSVAGLTVLGYVARRAAVLNADLRAVAFYSVYIPIIADILQTAYLAEGHPEKYKPESITYYSNERWAWASGVMGQIAREKPASLIMIGAWKGESLMFLETAAIHGVMAVGGTAYTAQIPFIVLCSRACLIGEEMFAAAAYISKDPISIATISGGDMGRFFIMAVTAIGVILATVGVKLLPSLLRL